MTKPPSNMFTIPPGKNGCPTTDEVRFGAPKDDGALSPDVEAEIIAAATQMPRSEETHIQCSARRERELAEIFNQITGVESLALGRRLDRDADADPVVAAFRRMAPLRRARLRAYLTDAKRRMSRSATTQPKKE